MTSLFVPQWLLHCCILTGTGLGMGIQTPKIDPVPGLRSSQSSGRDRHQMSNFKLEMETHSLAGFNCVAEVAGKTHEGDCLRAEHQRQCPSKWKSRRRNCRQRYSPWGKPGLGAQGRLRGPADGHHGRSQGPEVDSEGRGRTGLHCPAPCPTCWATTHPPPQSPWAVSPL